MSWAWCAACGRTFASERGFDRHRISKGDDRRCMTLDELRAKGWKMDKKGRYRKPVSRLRKALAALRSPRT